MTTKNQARHFSTSELFLTPLKENPALEEIENEDESDDEKSNFSRNALLLFQIHKWLFRFNQHHFTKIIVGGFFSFYAQKTADFFI